MSDTPKTLKDILEISAARYADRSALSFVGGEALTYARLLKLTKDLGTLLRDRGVKPGDKVALIGENMPNWAISYFAATSMGAIAVPILQEFHQSAVHHILRHSEAKTVIASNRYMYKIESESLPALETIMTMDDLSIVNEDAPKTEFTDAVEIAKERLEQFTGVSKEKLDKFGDAAKEKFEQIGDVAKEKFEQIGGAARKFMDRKSGKEPFALDENSVAAILYTSGTTGHSKGVVLTHGNLVSNALSGVEVIPIFETDRFLSVLPMSHTYECTVGLVVPMLCGSSVFYLQRPPTPRTLLPAMESVKPTVINVVPLIIEKIYKSRIKPKLVGGGLVRNLMKLGAARKKISQVAGKKLIEAFGGELRCMCIGGAALSPEVERFLADAGVPYAIGYGMTETSPLLAGTRPGRQRLRAIGPVLPGVRLKIADRDPDTGEGEILAKGPNVMREYFKAPRDTADTFTEDGWLKTGDLGMIDEDGYLYIKGRLKNVIIGPSGENIYPEEVESIINACDYVLESLVFDNAGQLVARIHLDYDALDEGFGVKDMIESEVRNKIMELLEAIRKEVNSKVSTFARLSRVIEQIEPFEKTPTHKIKRFIYLDN